MDPNLSASSTVAATIPAVMPHPPVPPPPRTGKPYVTIRKKGKPGKMVALPNTMQELLKVAETKLGFPGVAFCLPSSGDEIDDIELIEPGTILWFLTKEEKESMENN